MAFSWKILLPLTFVQVLINGAVLVYDAPLWILTITGLVGIVVLVRLIERAVRPSPAVNSEVVSVGNEGAP